MARRDGSHEYDQECQDVVGDEHGKQGSVDTVDVMERSVVSEESDCAVLRHHRRSGGHSVATPIYANVHRDNGPGAPYLERVSAIACEADHRFERLAGKRAP
jgi:hypothetical protein